MRPRQPIRISPATEAHFERLYDGVEGVIEILEVPEGRHLIAGGQRSNRRTRAARRSTRDGPTELVAGLPALIVGALRLCLMIAIGVLPRAPRTGTGRPRYLPGRAVWLDADLYAMGAPLGAGPPSSLEELRRRRETGRRLLAGRLEILDMPPSVMVDSGWGHHYFWYLADLTEPSEIVAANRAIADAVDSTDSTWDAGRMLRAPGSWNLKVPARRKLVRITRSNPERTYRAADLRSAAHSVAHGPPRHMNTRPAARATDPLIPQASVPRALPEPIARILEQDSVARDLYDGRGKTRGDLSDSGYDMSLVLHLARRGDTAVTADMLAATLLWRPRRRTRDLSYARRTVERALEWLDDHIPPPIGASTAARSGEATGLLEPPQVGRGSDVR